MDCLQLFYSLFLMVLFSLNDVQALTLTATKSAEKAVLGPNPFTLTCTYTLNSGEILYYFELRRKRQDENDFTTIVNYNIGVENASYSTVGKELESRTVATMPTDADKTVKLEFSEIECDDKATYRWFVNYFSNPDNINQHSDVSFVVKAKTLADARVSFNPNTNIEENDTVRFTCQGDVGNEPSGHLGWFYYLNNDTSKPVNASEMARPTTPVYESGSCSFRRTSTLDLTMTKSFHNILVRCTVQQDNFNQFGDGYAQTNNIPVYYKPRITAINDQIVDEGTKMLALTCSADAYPAPSYSWLLPNGTITDGPSYVLYDLALGDNGTYTCMVYNTFKGVNHTVNETTYIDVRKTTTPAPTSTPIASSTGSKQEGTTLSSKVASAGSDTTTIIIVVCVVLGLLIIIGIVVVVLCVKKRRVKEIEEPPEKPRNNQDLSYYGNRPDLVSADHGMKNNLGGNNLNSSFNNSFDSTDVKQRNEDGLLYVDLQFDDKPRSRRPIQILDDGGSTPYADIVNPRV